MKRLFLFTFVFIAFSTFVLQAQDISVGGNVGWAIPGGSGVTEMAEDLNLDGGLVYSIDALYHLNPNLGVGLSYTGAILAGGGEGDIDVFGMRVIGAKGYYTLKEEGFSPYFGLTLGLAQLLTPELTITDATGATSVIPENTGSGFGIMPEAGLNFGKFFLGVQYLVPVSYTIEEAQINDKAAGIFNIVAGYRYKFSF